MVKFSNKDRNEYLELPVRVEYEGRVYWIKRATKSPGIYMNDQPPKIEVLVKENDYTTISK